MDDRIEKNIHLEKEAKTNNQGYQEIEIAESSLVWYEEGREIVVNGVMFDVISIRNENGIAYITGIFDHDETEVLNKVGKLNRQTQKEKDGSVGSKFMAFVFYNESAPAYLLSPFATRLKHNVYWIFQMTSPIREIHCPPPRIVVA